MLLFGSKTVAPVLCNSPVSQHLTAKMTLHNARRISRSYSVKTENSELQKLPVPPLQQTIQKYLRSVKPLVTTEEFQVTQEIAKRFTAPGSIGEKLQQMLEQRASSTDNWLADWWLSAAYLSFRWPVVVYSNPGLVFPLRNFKSDQEQIAHAAVMISAALQFKKLLDEKKLPLEKMGQFPLDMSQYYKVIGTCRVPGITQDTLRYLDTSNPPRHITVIHNNHFFAVPVYGEQGEALNESQIEEQLQKVVANSARPAKAAVGILTSENRNVWGEIYDSLTKSDKANRLSLDMIESSLFVVCIDGPPSLAEKNAPNRLTSAAFKMTHGAGSQGNSANRWFDKTIQFVIGPDGEVGMTYEHSPADGQPIAVLMDYIEAYCEKYKGASIKPPALKVKPPQHLNFNISTDVQEAIRMAQTNLDSLVDDLEMFAFSYTGYGKEFVKTRKMSPDSFIQMAIQLAFYRLHKMPGAHYESASTRRFLYGRTETIRSCSLESVHFAKTMLDSSKSSKDKVIALRAGIEAHKEYATQALAGHGVDRHLLGLRQVAIESGINVPELFLDVGYTRSSHMRLSTSQVAGRVPAFMCYGPLVPDGYGCCYNPRADEIIFGTSAFNSCPDTSAVKFAEALTQSLDEMKAILMNVPLQAKL